MQEEILAILNNGGLSQDDKLAAIHAVITGGAQTQDAGTPKDGDGKP